jgi:hypothetical protein
MTRHRRDPSTEHFNPMRDFCSDPAGFVGTAIAANMEEPPP